MNRRDRGRGGAPNGLYGPRGGVPLGRTIVLGVVALAAIALVAFGVVRACGGDDCSAYFCPSNLEAPAPEGFELVTRIFEHNLATATPEAADLQVELPLSKDDVESSGLTFYEYDPVARTWDPITTATLLPGGGAVTGRLNFTPAYLAVLRRVSPGGHAVAYLAPNGTLHPDAAPYITMIHTRDFRPAGDGSVTGTLSAVAFDPRYQFVPTIYADASPEGGLAIVTGLLGTAETRTQHVAALVQVASVDNVAGIDLAYLDLPADQRTSFTLFVAELAQALHSSGKILTLTLPLPVRTEGAIDEGAYDWAELGRNADLLQMQPYLDQQVYRNRVPELLDHLTAIVDPAKLILTVSPLATEVGAGTDTIRTMTIVEAMQIATRLTLDDGGTGTVETDSNYDVIAVNINKEASRSGIAWSPEAAAVFFTYENDGGRTVFLENIFSIAFKLDYARRYNLGGVAVADASENVYLGNVWPALVTFFSSGQPLLLQPNSQDLQPSWEVTGGSYEGGLRGIARWTTPAEPGSYSILLTVSDGVALFESELPVNVVARDAPAATPTAED